MRGREGSWGAVVPPSNIYVARVGCLSGARVLLISASEFDLSFEAKLAGSG